MFELAIYDCKERALVAAKALFEGVAVLRLKKVTRAATKRRLCRPKRLIQTASKASLWLKHRVTRRSTEFHREKLREMQTLTQELTQTELATIVIGRAIDVHRALGPGLLESAYQECLSFELQEAGLFVEREKPMPIEYKGVRLEHGYRLDLLIKRQLVVELKTVDIVLDVHEAQLLTYLKLGGYKLGLLINFRVPLLREGITRLANFSV